MDAGRDSDAIDETAVARAAETLRRGGLVAFPTETVYGLGANALDATAVARVFEVKGRPRFDPLIVHVADAAAARDLTAAWPMNAERLAQAFWPGPMTLVLPKRPVVPDLVTAGLPSVAVRVPDHGLALALLQRAGVPVAAPSANRFGGVSPTMAEHVRSELGERVEVVLDGGPCRTGVESTVVSLVEAERPRVLRLGGLAVERIEAVVGEVVIVEPGAGAKPQAAAREAEELGRQSPGMLERHYAPRTAMRVVEGISDFGFRISDLSGAHPQAQQEVKVGALVFGRSAEQVRAEFENPKSEIRNLKLRLVAIESLSPTGDLVEAAANLFAAMRRLDAAGLDLIVAERVPEEGLGRAINDRLRRAAAS